MNLNVIVKQKILIENILVKLILLNIINFKELLNNVIQ